MRKLLFKGMPNTKSCKVTSATKFNVEPHNYELGHEPTKVGP